MLREANAMIIVSESLIALGIALKLLISRYIPWRIPGGWPLGSRYYRIDTFAFGIFFSAGIVAGFPAVFRAFEWPRS